MASSNVLYSRPFATARPDKICLHATIDWHRNYAVFIDFAVETFGANDSKFNSVATCATHSASCYFQMKLLVNRIQYFMSMDFERQRDAPQVFNGAEVQKDR